MKVLLATNNRHKVAELGKILPIHFQLQTLSDIGFTDDIPETGSTFEENAAIKCRTIYAQFGLNCLADDSGLMIDALDGAPGVFSARYAGETSNDEQNVKLVLKNMADTGNRKARFVTVICLIWNGQEYFFRGELPGFISQQPKGTNGFGYDPVFIPEGYNQTLAELSPDEKNRISHRARAVSQVVDFLKSV